MGDRNQNFTNINPIEFKQLFSSSTQRLPTIPNFVHSNSIPLKFRVYHFEVHAQVSSQTELFAYLHEYRSDCPQINCNTSSNVSTRMPDVFRTSAHVLATFTTTLYFLYFVPLVPRGYKVAKHCTFLKIF